MALSMLSVPVNAQTDFETEIAAEANVYFIVSLMNFIDLKKFIDINLD